MVKRIGVVILILVLAACAASVSRRALPPTPVSPTPIPPAASFRSLPAAGTYRIDSAQSELRLLVYRGGALAHLGHNHVMVNHSVTGTVEVGDAMSASSFTLNVPVAAFEVDDTEARRQEGADFPGEISQEAKSGTLHNMLGEALLNAARYPAISVKSLSIDTRNGAPTVTLGISVAGHDSTVDVPCTLQGDAHQLTVTGAFELRQTAIGLTPYSLMGGALQVLDVMKLKFKFVVMIG